MSAPNVLPVAKDYFQSQGADHFGAAARLPDRYSFRRLE